MIYPIYSCPWWTAPFLEAMPEDINLPEIDIPGIGTPGDDNITDDPEEGQIVGPIIPPTSDTTGVDTVPEPGSLANEAGEPLPPPDLPTVHTDVTEKIRADRQPDECVEDCDQCPPRIEGVVDWRTYISSGVNETNSGDYMWAGYQAYICGLPNDPANGRIKEFIYLTDDRGQPYPWDGFESGSCTLIECKYGYDTGLTDGFKSVIGSDGQEDARMETVVDPERKFVVDMTFEALIRQARRQLRYISGVEEAKLLWVFSSFYTQDYFFWNGGGGVGVAPKFRTFYIPWSGRG
ncbi:Tox-REase-5 domain-containing protein [Yoonia sp. 2307UL14-13]|uniref:Tox-REase-5 domain-containing protein n=1 Tax=Yoonia sp. 2307UL14-13 TaxID=3126506 RepID=UPI0030A5941F